MILLLSNEQYVNNKYPHTVYLLVLYNCYSLFTHCLFDNNKSKNLNITPKKLLQRLPILLAQVQVGNISENLLNKIRQIVYSLNQAKQISKKVFDTESSFCPMSSCHPSWFTNNSRFLRTSKSLILRVQFHVPIKRREH